MAKIPRSERSVSFDPTNQPVSTYDAGAPGKALMGLGEAIGGLSGALEEQQNKLDDFNTKMAANDFQLGQAEKFNQYKDTISGDGKDFDTNWANQEDQDIANYAATNVPQNPRSQRNFVLGAKQFQAQRILQAQGLRLDQAQVHFGASGDDFIEKHAIGQVTQDPASVDSAMAGVENFITSARRDGMSEKSIQEFRQRAATRLQQAYIASFTGPDGKSPDAKNMAVAAEAYLKKADESQRPLEGEILPPLTNDPGRIGYGGQDPSRARYGMQVNPKDAADFAGQQPQTDAQEDPGSGDRDIDLDPKLATGQNGQPAVPNPQRQSDAGPVSSGRQLGSLVKLSPYITGNDKNHSIDLLKPQFASALGSALQAMPADLRDAVQIEQGGRSREYQAKLYQNYRSGRGGLAAPPGYSRHEFGEAVDLGPTSPKGERDPKFQAALAWLYKNGEQYGVLNPPSIRSRDSGHFQFARATGGSGSSDGVNGVILAAAQKNGVDPGLMRAYAQIESDDNPKAKSSAGYKGLFQLSDAEFKKNGGGNIYDAEDNANAAAKKIAGDIADFKKQYGRDPTAAELYMVHQQGASGSAAHFANPNGVAWKNVAQYYPNASVAKSAISGNLPPELKGKSVDSITSGEFVQAWNDHFNKVSGGMGSTRMALGGPIEQPIPNARYDANAREQPLPNSPLYSGENAERPLQNRFSGQVADASGSTVSTRIAKGGYARNILEQQNTEQGVAVQKFPGQPTTQSLFRDMLRKSLPAIKNHALEAERAQIKAQKDALEARRTQAAHDGIVLMSKGQLTREWVDQQDALGNLTNTTLKSFNDYLKPHIKVTDPALMADLRARIKDEPQSVMHEALTASNAGRLSDRDFGQIIQQAQREQSADAKTPEWMANTEKTLRDAIRPKEGASEEEWNAYNDTMKVFSDHTDEIRGVTSDNQGRQHQKKLDIPDHAKLYDYTQKLIEQHKTRQLLTRRQSLAQPRFSTVDPDHMDFDTVKTASDKTVEALKAGQITKEEFLAEIAKLQEMDSILRSEAKLAGKPVPPPAGAAKPQRPPGMMHLGGPMPTERWMMVKGDRFETNDKGIVKNNMAPDMKADPNMRQIQPGNYDDPNAENNLITDRAKTYQDGPSPSLSSDMARALQDEFAKR